MVEHELSEVVGCRGGLDAKATEHGVGFPSAEELDGVAVDTCAQECGGASWAEGACGEESGLDSGGGLD